jgi:hypothetical protein
MRNSDVKRHLCHGQEVCFPVSLRFTLRSDRMMLMVWPEGIESRADVHCLSLPLHAGYLLLERFCSVR